MKTLLSFNLNLPLNLIPLCCVLLFGVAGPLTTKASANDFSSGISCGIWRDQMQIEQIDLAAKTAQVSIEIHSHNSSIYRNFAASLAEIGDHFLRFDFTDEVGFVLLDTSDLSTSRNPKQKNAQLVWPELKKEPKNGSWAFSCQSYSLPNIKPPKNEQKGVPICKVPPANDCSLHNRQRRLCCDCTNGTLSCN